MDKVLQLSIELSRAVSFLHNCNPPIIHRDLKVENLLVGKDGSVKLADFGMAHIVADVAADPTGRGLKRGIGSRKYRAPELFEKPCRPYSGFKADVWALGCVLYCLVNGDLPFGGKTKKDLVYNIQNRPITVTKRMDREPALNKLLQGMLCKDWDRRISLDEALGSRWLSS